MCFLSNRMILSTGPCMLRDIFLLENQLPWLVIEALSDFLTTPPVYKFVHKIAKYLYIIPPSSLYSNTRARVDELRKYRPPHLLGLLRYSQIGNMTSEDHNHIHPLSLASTSAIELAEIGIKLTASKKKGLANMSIQTDYCLFGGQLSLTPLFINDFTACWLVNMAAYEACVSTRYPSDGFVVSSYISLLAMLMDREEDVHQLRAKHLVRSLLGNHELLVFFKGLACHLRLGRRYFTITGKIDRFKRRRPVSIAVHRFVYKNFKTIVAVLSITGVLAGIFRTLMSLKQHQP
ncbi:hypothetical protein CFC21_100446 [Triticum aestivum]|uniref:Uncharacterized protein n=2 Tax=Triticum aestivum TaxID=4565 RepID=A0A3B6RS63_WHEAT|nr:hypothetical protein CFC21_100446 [Triticum aestivum]